MGKSSGGGIGLGTIVFVGFIVYNVFFDDDDDKKDVESKKSSEPAIEETSEVSIQDEASKIINIGKKAFIEIRDGVKDAVNKKSEKIVDAKPPEEPKEEPSKPDEIIITSDDRKEVLSSIEKNEDEVPSLSIPDQQTQVEQPTFRTIE